MKEHYDFSEAEQGRLYRQGDSLRIPVYLDEDVHQWLVQHGKQPGADFSKVVNAILRLQRDVVEKLAEK